MYTWEFRYRHNKGVDTVHIQTFTKQEAEAKQLADAYLQRLTTPNLRFVYVRLIVVASSDQYPELKKKWEKAPTKEPQAASANEDPDAADLQPKGPDTPVTPPAGASRRGSTPGRVGA